MQIIIGLGNPGEKYKDTRHNIGFMILDRLKEIAHFSNFQLNDRFSSLIAEKKDAAEEKILLVKPQTFMNCSGEAVRSLADFYKIPLENIFVIHDDLDINIGEYKISCDASSAGHRGVQNIIDTLGSQKFTRIRLGIEGIEKRKERIVPGDEFVLQKFADEELKLLKLTEEDVKETGIAGAIAFELKL